VLRARRAALLLPFSQALEVEKRYRRESLPEAVVDLLDVVTRGFYDASAALREARLAAAPSVDPPRHARDSGVVPVVRW
jgi:hypothetical protein